MGVVLEGGSISCDSAVVLEKWKRDFCSLLNCQTDNDPQTDNNTVFNAHISVFEVKKAIDRAKKMEKDAEPMPFPFPLKFYATMRLFPPCTYYSTSTLKRTLFPLFGSNAS